MYIYLLDEEQTYQIIHLPFDCLQV